MLYLHRKHNLGNSSDLTSAYTQPWFAATVSHCCYFRRCWGFPGAVEQGARHAEPYHRQGVSTPQLPGAKPDACHHRSPHPSLWPASTKGHVPREGHTGPWRASRKGKEWWSAWDIFSKLANKPQVGCWLLSTSGSVYHRLGHGVRGQNTSRQLHQWPDVLPQASIQSLCGFDSLNHDREKYCFTYLGKLLCELTVPQCQDWLISKTFLVVFVFTAESGDGKAGIMPPCPDYQTYKPHPHSVMIFFL